MKSGNLTFLEAYAPLQACNGTALPFYVENWEKQRQASARYLPPEPR